MTGAFDENKIASARNLVYMVVHHQCRKSLYTVFGGVDLSFIMHPLAHLTPHHLQYHVVPSPPDTWALFQVAVAAPPCSLVSLCAVTMHPWSTKVHLMTTVTVKVKSLVSNMNLIT